MCMLLMFDEDIKNTYWGCVENCIFYIHMQKNEIWTLSQTVHKMHSNWLKTKHKTWVLSFQKQNQKVLYIYLSNDMAIIPQYKQPKPIEANGTVSQSFCKSKEAKWRNRVQERTSKWGIWEAFYTHTINHKLKQSNNKRKVLKTGKRSN